MVFDDTGTLKKRHNFLKSLMDLPLNTKQSWPTHSAVQDCSNVIVQVDQIEIVRCNFFEIIFKTKFYAYIEHIEIESDVSHLTFAILCWHSRLQYGRWRQINALLRKESTNCELFKLSHPKLWKGTLTVNKCILNYHNAFNESPWNLQRQNFYF